MKVNFIWIVLLIIGAVCLEKISYAEKKETIEEKEKLVDSIIFEEGIEKLKEKEVKFVDHNLKEIDQNTPDKGFNFQHPGFVFYGGGIEFKIKTELPGKYRLELIGTTKGFDPEIRKVRIYIHHEKIGYLPQPEHTSSEYYRKASIEFTKEDKEPTSTLTLIQEGDVVYLKEVNIYFLHE